MVPPTKPRFEPHRPIKYGLFDESKPPAVPAEHQPEGHFLPSFDRRLWMFHRKWTPPEGTETKGTLMIVHGTVDHSGVYSQLAKILTSKVGIAVFAMDMRGWGLSDGESMYFNDRDTFLEDANHFYQHIHNQEPFSSVKHRFLMGKSLGGTLGAYLVQKYPEQWTGWIGLSGAFAMGPNFKVPPSIVMGLLQMVAMWHPKMPFQTLFDVSEIVKDPAAQEAWKQDKLCCKDKLRLAYCLNILDALRDLASTKPEEDNKAAVVSRIPTLMICGDEDKIVTLQGHQIMLDKTQNDDKKLIAVPQGKHNLLQEPALQAQVMDDIQKWILDHVKATA